jgi:RNA recognition motif-containing protein
MASTANTVRISNMSELTTEDQVRALVGQAGQVKSIQMVRDGKGDSVGAAFVELRNQTEVDNAIRLLDGKQYDHQTIEVTQA